LATNAEALDAAGNPDFASSLRQIPTRLPIEELAPLEHAPLPAKGGELHCGARYFMMAGGQQHQTFVEPPRA
jgi:hypothetical protein